MDFLINPPIGERVRRKETQRFVTGTGRYVDDLLPPGTLHVAFVRSVCAHAKMRSIDVEAARSMPGVRAVFTGKEIAQDLKPLRVGGSSVLRPVKLYPLAVDKVRYFGEPVVAVIADNRYLAEDATEAVSVDYEMLPVVVDPEASMEPGAPLVHEDAGSNIVYQYHFATDGIDKIFQEADVVIKEKIRSHQITACPIEPRAYLAHYNKDEDTLKGQLFYHRNPNEAAKFIMEVLRITDFNEAKDIWRERDKQASEIAKIGQATEEVMMTNNKCIDI